MELSRIRVRIGVVLVIAAALGWSAAPGWARRLPPVDVFGAAPAPDTADLRSPKLKAVSGSVAIEPRLGVPTFVRGRAVGEFLRPAEPVPTPMMPQDAEAAARAHLRDLADLYRITAAEVNALPLKDQQSFPDGGAVVRYANSVDGVEVFREHASVLLDRFGSLVAIGGYVTGMPAVRNTKARVFALDARQAIAVTLADYRFAASVDRSLEARGESGGYTIFALPAGLHSEDGSVLETVRVKPVWFRTGEDVVAAYYVETQVRDGISPGTLDAHAYVISAAGGALLYRHNQTADAAFTYRVYAESAGGDLLPPGPIGRNGFPHPAGTPDADETPGSGIYVQPAGSDLPLPGPMGRNGFPHPAGMPDADEARTSGVYPEPAGSYLPLPGPMGRNGFPHPTGTPDGYQAAIVKSNLVTLQNAPFSRNDPWLAEGATTTTGNNVEAFANLAGPDNFGPADPSECDLAQPVSGDLHACTNRPATFDYAYDPLQAPDASRAQVMAAVTNLFYMNNYLHDWYYDAGFDEAAGNAQLHNYERGGVGSDSIYAEAHDNSGSDNADMTTPADGGRPRMRMYLWSSSAALSQVYAPAALAGIKQAGTAAFGAKAFDLTNDLVLVFDEANTEGPTVTDGCTPFSNAAAVAGRIAVIDRGTCLFVVKVTNAQVAGAAAVLIVNNVAGLVSMAGADETLTIPVLSVSLADGTAIKDVLGAGGRVNMRLARKSAVPRDGAIDNTLIAHEWGHYISNRLIANANGLTTQQAGGLGEGFADFHAMLLMVKDGDRLLPTNAGFAGAYAQTAYPTSGPDFPPAVINNAWYYGIRRYPYSRDMSRNPLTFRHIADGVALPEGVARSPVHGTDDNAEVHNTGEVWGSMLWECYSNLLNDSSRLPFAKAQERMKRYLVAAYKMMPANPTFIEARDAILAVMEAQDPQDYLLCQHGFAKRGAGVGAVAPSRYSENNAGVIESYQTVLPTKGTRSPVID